MKTIPERVRNPEERRDLVLDLVVFLEWLDQNGELTFKNDDESHEATALRFLRQWEDDNEAEQD